MVNTHIPSFNAGELSPLIYLRSDLEKYRNGCRTLENMLVTPYGGAQKRAGLSYTATASGKARLFPFQAAIDKGFILEFTNLSLRFFKRDSPVQSGGGDYTVATPYAARDLSKLSIRQINNIAYLTHPNYPVQKLTRFADNNWTLVELDYSYPPMLPENVVSSQTITTVTAGEKGDTINLTSSFSLFTQEHINGFFAISHPRDPDEFEVKLKATSANNNQYSSVLTVQGNASFRTQGTWDGTFVIEVDRGDGFIELARYSSASDANYTAEFTEDSRARMRIKWEHSSGGSSNPAAFLEATSAYVSGLVKITGVTSATNATAEVIQGVEAGATEFWREGAFSPVQGYPRAVCTHEQRLCFGGTESQPQTIWASAVDDYENFEPGVNDDQSWSHTIVSGQQNDIQWLESQRALLIGTTGDEWVLSSSKDETIITPTNVRARRHSRNGSEFIPPITVDSVTMFAQRGGRVVREMSYSFEADGYQTNELTLLAEHVTGTGIKEMVWQTHPDQVLWAVTKDGQLLSMTYDRSQNVVGWARHTTAANGKFESVAIRQAEGEDDQIWVVVQRTINGSQVRYIERLKPDGFFLEEPWSLQYQDTFGMTPWASMSDLGSTGAVELWGYHYLTYKANDLIAFRDTSGTQKLAFIHADFTTTDASYYSNPNLFLDDYTDNSYPLDTVANPNDVGVWAIPWSASAGGNPDRLYTNNGNLYVVTSSHPPGTIEPGVTAGWESNWDLLVANYSVVATGPPEYASPATDDGWVQSDDGTYQTATYEDGDYFTYGGVYYRAKVSGGAHDARPIYEPGVGASWTTVMDVATYHAVDDEVVNDGAPYKCILAHTPDSSSEPGVGGSWTTYWEVIQTDYTLGDLVSSDGVNYRCTVTHTPASATEPGIGASWTTVWEVLTDEESIRFYVDSGVTQINPGALTEVTGLSHLEGETVQVSANGAVLKSRTVSGGKILLDEEGDPTNYTDISVGLGYTGTLEPMALEIVMKNGTSTSREKQIHELVIYFQESYGAKVGTSASGPFDKVPFYNANLGTPVSLFTGPMVHKLEDRHSLDATFIIKNDTPMPFHVLCIIPKWNAYGDN